MAIAVINTATGAIVKSDFDKKKDATDYVKAMEAVENAQARLNYWDRKEFPIAETLSR